MAARRVVVVGGGVAGASISRELSKAGCKVTLLERSNQLCSGATWHAAGLVTRFAGSSKLKKLHVRSMALLEEMHERHGGVGLHLTGRVRPRPSERDARAFPTSTRVPEWRRWWWFTTFLDAPLAGRSGS